MQLAKYKKAKRKIKISWFKISAENLEIIAKISTGKIKQIPKIIKSKPVYRSRKEFKNVLASCSFSLFRYIVCGIKTFLFKELEKFTISPEMAMI